MVHCHNLPHEDHDMMHQFSVGLKDGDVDDERPDLGRPGERRLRQLTAGPPEHRAPPIESKSGCSPWFSSPVGSNSSPTCVRCRIAGPGGRHGVRRSARHPDRPMVDRDRIRARPAGPAGPGPAHLGRSARRSVRPRDRRGGRRRSAVSAVRRAPRPGYAGRPSPARDGRPVVVAVGSQYRPCGSS